MIISPQYERTALLLGEEGLAALRGATVVVAGLGGVGGHCAEALARTGVGRLHLIDSDVVTQSNLNRQLVATRETIGQKKTLAMAQRIGLVAQCALVLSDRFITPDTVDDILPAKADFLIDAIDFVPGKTALIQWAFEHGVPMISCMGAGNRLDPGQLYIGDLFQTSGDPLARKLRHEIRKRGIPSLPVVVSREPSHAKPGQTVIGSLAPVTAAAGMMAAAYAVRVITGIK